MIFREPRSAGLREQRFELALGFQAERDHVGNRDPVFALEGMKEIESFFQFLEPRRASSKTWLRGRS